MKQIKIVKEDKNIESILFIIAWTIFVASLIMQACAITIDNDEVELVLKLTRYVSYLVCCISIMYKVLKRQQYIVLMTVVAVFLNCYLQAKNATMPLYSLILLAAVGISWEIILKTTVIAQSILLGGIVLLSQLGIIQD